MKLSSTSALVLLWAFEGCYKGKAAGKFLNMLDLEEGRRLYGLCNEICPYYGEIIRNRKYGIFALVKKVCEKGEGDKFQVIIAGAGFDALGLEIREFFPRAHVFELDRENMDAKRLMAREIGIDPEKHLFVSADIMNSRDVAAKLAALGWTPALPTLLVMEGISYYVPENSLRLFVRNLRPKWTILEYLKLEEEIAPDRAQIPSGVFGLIASMCKVPEIIRYNSAELFDSFGGSMDIPVKYGMKQLEKMRTGSNRYFPNDESGWIEVCLLDFLPKGTTFVRAGSKKPDPLF